MSSYSGYMTVYNSYGATITGVKATHTTSKGITQEISAASLDQGGVVAAVSIEAFSDQDDNWTLSFLDANGHARSVAFSNCGFKEEDATGTLIFNLSQMGVKLCFPQSDDEWSTY